MLMITLLFSKEIIWKDIITFWNNIEIKLSNLGNIKNITLIPNTCAGLLYNVMIVY